MPPRKSTTTTAGQRRKPDEKAPLPVGPSAEKKQRRDLSASPRASPEKQQQSSSESESDSEKEEKDALDAYEKSRNKAIEWILERFEAGGGFGSMETDRFKKFVAALRAIRIATAATDARSGKSTPVGEWESACEHERFSKAIDNLVELLASLGMITRDIHIVEQNEKVSEPFFAVAAASASVDTKQEKKKKKKNGSESDKSDDDDDDEKGGDSEDDDDDFAKMKMRAALHVNKMLEGTVADYVRGPDFLWCLNTIAAHTNGRGKTPVWEFEMEHAADGYPLSGAARQVIELLDELARADETDEEQELVKGDIFKKTAEALQIWPVDHLDRLQSSLNIVRDALVAVIQNPESDYSTTVLHDEYTEKFDELDKFIQPLLDENRRLKEKNSKKKKKQSAAAAAESEEEDDDEGATATPTTATFVKSLIGGDDDKKKKKKTA